MNKILVAIALASATLTAFGQGSVTFSNAGGQPIWLGRPAGSTFQAALLWAPKDTPDAAFDAVAQQLGAPVNFGPVVGLFSGGGRTINGLTPAGDVAKFQVRVWDTIYGSSYDEARCSGDPNAEFGKTIPFAVDTANPLIGEPNAPIAPFIPAFPIDPVGGGPTDPPCVPEPSTIFLGLSAVGFFFFCRRKSP